MHPAKSKHLHFQLVAIHQPLFSSTFESLFNIYSMAQTRFCDSFLVMLSYIWGQKHYTAPLWIFTDVLYIELQIQLN